MSSMLNMSGTECTRHKLYIASTVCPSNALTYCSSVFCYFQLQITTFLQLLWEMQSAQKVQSVQIYDSLETCVCKGLNLWQKRMKSQTEKHIISTPCLPFELPAVYINYCAMQLSLLLEWQCFPHLLQRLLSKVIDLARSKCSLVVLPLALFDWASKLLKDLWQARCLWRGLVLLPSHVAQWCSQHTVPRSQWFKLTGRPNPTQISQMWNICSHNFKAAPWAL